MSDGVQQKKRTRARAKQLVERSLFDLKLAGDAMKAAGFPTVLIDELRSAWSKAKRVSKAVSADVHTEADQ